MPKLDGIWDVRRRGGLLPPLIGVRKRIDGGRGATTIGPGPGVPFDVVGTELRYRAPLSGFVDRLDPVGEGRYAGSATFHGLTYGRFELIRLERGAMDATEQQLVKHVDEAYAMEQNVLRMLDGMIQTTDDPEIVDLLEHHKVETQSHVQRMKERLEAHGASPSIVREAGGILAAFAKLPLDIVRSEKAGRNARDAYASEHLEIASYQLLERIARNAGDHETVAAAKMNRGEDEAMARKLEGLWDRFAELALEEQGVPLVQHS
jgi:ferritin-like metal-binding protein YciE